MREGKASERDPGKIAATGVLRLCSGLARRGGGERKERAPLVSERERGETGRATEGERVRARRGWSWLAGALGCGLGDWACWPGAWRAGFFLFFWITTEREN